MAVECVDFHSKAGELKMYGFALPDQGFYSIEIPGGMKFRKPQVSFKSCRGKLLRRKLKKS
jgi:hypothetical protein